MTLRPSIAGTRPRVTAEIDQFATTLHRFAHGLVPEAVFLEARLRMGVYGQRQDGVHMMRSKLPLGLIAPDQLDAFADLTERYGHGVAHLTTRQDIQVHFIRLDESPDVMRVLADAEMTSREACGNVVRNVTATPLAGVLPGEPFDVTPAAMALATYLLRIPDGQSLGRKFKVTFAATSDPRFDTTAFHDLGFTARVVDGVAGFHVRVGGGLGAVPHEAPELTPFLPLDELLPVSKAVLRVFARHGEKHKRARARLKFLVADWGVARFREAVAEERAGLAPEEAWTAWIDAPHPWTDAPLHPAGAAWPVPRGDDDATWLRTNVLRQRQPGYAAVQVRVPQGDLDPARLRGLAELLRAHAGDTMRIGPDQSLWIRHVAFDHLLPLRDGLVGLGLGLPRAGRLGDTVTCPGADTCKLGITSPRSVARHIQDTLDGLAEDPVLEDLRVHVSGCPNGCGTHHVADIGLFGAARTVGGVTAPHYMVLLGGRAGGTDGVTLGAGFGTTVAKIPAARVGEAITALAALFRDEVRPGEVFADVAGRLGRARLKALLDGFTALPAPDEAPHLYREHGKDEAFGIVRGTGECAGAVVLQADLLLVDADREAQAASDALDAGDDDAVRAHALAAFDAAARALLSTQGEADPADVAGAFRARIYDAGVIFEGVGHYYLQAVAEAPPRGDRLRRLAVEAGLFVEEAHAVVGRLQNPARRAPRAGAEGVAP